MKATAPIFIIIVSFAGGILGAIANDWLGIENFAGILGIFAAAQTLMLLLAIAFRKLILGQDFFPGISRGTNRGKA